MRDGWHRQLGPEVLREPVPSEQQRVPSKKNNGLSVFGCIYCGLQAAEEED